MNNNKPCIDENKILCLKFSKYEEKNVLKIPVCIPLRSFQFEINNAVIAGPQIIQIKSTNFKSIFLDSNKYSVSGKVVNKKHKLEANKKVI